jgi:hypothetical protein
VPLVGDLVEAEKKDQRQDHPDQKAIQNANRPRRRRRARMAVGNKELGPTHAQK